MKENGLTCTQHYLCLWLCQLRFFLKGLCEVTCFSLVSVLLTEDHSNEHYSQKVSISLAACCVWTVLTCNQNSLHTNKLMPLYQSLPHRMCELLVYFWYVNPLKSSSVTTPTLAQNHNPMFWRRAKLLLFLNANSFWCVSFHMFTVPWLPRLW